MPKRIVTRWGKHVGSEQQTEFHYDITPGLKRVNVRAGEFKKYWAFVAPRMSGEELFKLFKQGGFGQLHGRTIDGEVKFVKEIMRRFQVTGGAVRLSHMPLMYVSLWLYVHPDFVVVVLSP